MGCGVHFIVYTIFPFGFIESPMIAEFDSLPTANWSIEDSIVAQSSDESRFHTSACPCHDHRYYRLNCILRAGAFYNRLLPTASKHSPAPASNPVAKRDGCAILDTAQLPSGVSYRTLRSAPPFACISYLALCNNNVTSTAKLVFVPLNWNWIELTTYQLPVAPSLYSRDGYIQVRRYVSIHFGRNHN